MSEQPINSEFYAYFNRLSLGQKESILSLIKSFVKTDDLEERISLEQYNQEIDDAEFRIKNGESVLQDNLVKEAEKW